MISKTKFELDNATIQRLFQKAGIKNPGSIVPLGAGEYNAAYSVTAQGKDYVLKIAPPDSVPVLTYEYNMMQSELFWYEQLRTYTDVRVPEVYYTDLSKTEIPAGWYIMEKLPGRQMNEFRFKSKAEKKEAQKTLAATASQLHRIKNTQFGYIQNGLYDNWYAAIRSFVENLLKDCAAAGKTSKRGERLLQWIDREREVLENAPCAMVHFDLWAGNILCTRENGQVQYAWIDPERSFWGDPILDFCNLESGSAFPKKTDSITAYNAVAEQKITQSRAQQLRYAVGLGYLALIVETEKYFRYSPKHKGWWRNTVLSAFLFRQAFSALNDKKEE